jgi:copper chaperone CopZ
MLPTTAITVAHELEQRLRLRCRQLTRRNINSAYVEAGLESIPGVTGVRINTSAACIVVNYDGTNTTRKAILTYLATLSGQALDGGGREKNLLSALTLVVRGGLALSLLILPPPSRPR